MTISKLLIFSKYIFLVFIAVALLYLKIEKSPNKFLNPAYYTFQGKTYFKPVDVKSSVVGNVDKINFQKGERVKKGDLLVILKNEEYLFDLEKYSQNKTIPFDVLDNLQKSIQNLNIYSEVDGTVVSENIKLGEKVFPSQRLITTSDNSSYRYLLQMSYEEYNSQTIDFKSNLKVGNPVVISYFDEKNDITSYIENIDIKETRSADYISVYLKPTKYVEFNPLEEVKVKFYKHSMFDNFTLFYKKLINH